LNEAYDEEALWNKARLFINHAMDLAEPRTFDERALWASLTLELLAKAALAHVSPLLIAAPNEEGTNLLIASGLVPGDGTFISVAAKTLFQRCSKAFRPFDAAQAQKIAAARNNYLHGGAASFTRIPEEAWWPSFWAQAVILLTAQDKDVDDFVGPDRIKIVDDHLARNKRNVEHKVEMLIARAAQRLDLIRSGTASARLAAQWSSPFDVKAYLAHSVKATCPACGATGTLEGDYELSSTMRHDQISEEDWETYVDLTVSADYFSCPQCRLVLNGYELIEAAELPLEFGAIGDPADYVEAEYGND
jgi:hypothetical protein